VENRYEVTVDPRIAEARGWRQRMVDLPRPPSRPATTWSRRATMSMSS